MSSPPRRLPPKKEVILELLTKSGVFLHLDPRREGVVVPAQFRKQAELVLQVGLNMAVPVRDLEVDEEGVSCTLSFNRSPFWCRMPWPSVFAIVSDEDRRGVVWPEDVPAESKLAGPAAAPAPKRPRLRAVGPADGPSDPAPSDEEGRGDAPEGEGTCGACGTRWVEGQDACPICGASRADAWRAAGDGSPAGEALAAADAADASADDAAAPSKVAAPRTRPQAVPDRKSAPPEHRSPEAAVSADATSTGGAAATGSAEPSADVAPSEDERPAEGAKPKRQLPPYLRIVK